MLLQNCEQNIRWNLAGRTNHNNYFCDFSKLAWELEKAIGCFSSFNPFPSSPYVTTVDSNLFQCSKIVFGSKTRPFFPCFHWWKNGHLFKVMLQLHDSASLMGRAPAGAAGPHGRSTILMTCVSMRIILNGHESRVHARRAFLRCGKIMLSRDVFMLVCNQQ